MRAVLVVLGAYVCLMGSFVHRHVAHAGGIDVPWGLVLAVGGTYAVVLGANRSVRVGGAWFGVGWAIALIAQQFLSDGSYLIASDWLGWTFVAGALGAIVLAVVRAPRVVR